MPRKSEIFSLRSEFQEVDLDSLKLTRVQKPRVEAFVGGKSIEEIASQLEVSPNAVRNSINVASTIVNRVKNNMIPRGNGR